MTLFPVPPRLTAGAPRFATMLRTGSLGLLVLLLTACAVQDTHDNVIAAFFTQHERTSPSATAPAGGVLKVMTLNVAHGRGDGFHQLFQNNRTHLDNLDRIVALLESESPHVVALQETDDASFWSGNFSHLDYLAMRGAYPQTVLGAHMDAIGLSYGTALISRLDLSEPQAVTFDPSISPIPKGFVVSQIDWPGSACAQIDVVSLHLDFMGETARRRQAAELIQTLRQRSRPVIIMGDFNTEWHRPDSTVAYIAGELGLKAYEPGTEGLTTFPAMGKRLDWILVSEEFDFHAYHVRGDVVSDHRGVVAELTLNHAAPLFACGCPDSLQTADRQTGSGHCRS